MQAGRQTGRHASRQASRHAGKQVVSRHLLLETSTPPPRPSACLRSYPPPHVPFSMPDLLQTSPAIKPSACLLPYKRARFTRGINENVELSQVSVLAIPKTHNCHTFQVLISKKHRTVEIVTSKRVAGANVMISFLAFPMGKRQIVMLNSRFKKYYKDFFYFRESTL